MKRVAGYGAWVDRESGKVIQEMDTCKCVHCQAHIFVKPGSALTVYLIPDPLHLGAFTEEPGAWCRNCVGPVCLRCHHIGICDPYMRQIERSESDTERRDALARMGRYVAGDPNPIR